MIHLCSPSVARGCAYSRMPHTKSGPLGQYLCVLVSPYSALSWHPEEQNVPVVGLCTPNGIAISCTWPCPVLSPHRLMGTLKWFQHVHNSTVCIGHAAARHCLTALPWHLRHPCHCMPHACCYYLLVRPLPSQGWCSPGSVSQGRSPCWTLEAMQETPMAWSKEDMEPAGVMVCHGTLHNGLCTQSFCTWQANFTAHLPPSVRMPVTIHFVCKEGSCAMSLAHHWLKSDYLSPQCDIWAALHTLYES